MPYEWLKNPTPATAPGDAAALRARLRLWPYQSLSPRGFVTFIALTCGLFAVPLIGLIGSPVLWGLLPFIIVVVAGVWLALMRSWQSGEASEDLSLWSDRALLRHRAPDGREQCWEANPHWISVHLHETDGPVPHYLTLRGGDREVELGRFLSEDERIALARELKAALATLR
jgi:uncharacterized membrane protein